MLRRQPPLIIHTHDTRTEYVDRNVTINRAPTDESVALLREMEQEAEAEVIKAVKVGDTSFECVIHTRRDAASDTVTWRAVFKLNGRQMSAEHTAWCQTVNDISAMATALRDEVAKVIAREVLNAGFSKIDLT